MTEQSDTELLITRSFRAPAALLFRLWSDPVHMKRWMGPRGFECLEAQIDFRVGGAYRCMIKTPAGNENWFGGTYREIVPDRRIVFTFTWDNDGPSAGIETVVTITFEEQDGSTVQRFHQAPFRDAARRDSHRGGWSSTFDKQEEYAETFAKEDGL